MLGSRCGAYEEGAQVLRSQAKDAGPALMPSVVHWRDHSSSGSAMLRVLIPRGRRASITARTRPGARNASGRVSATWRLVQRSRSAIWSIVAPPRTSSSHRRPNAIERSTTLPASFMLPPSPPLLRLLTISSRLRGGGGGHEILFVGPAGA